MNYTNSENLWKEITLLNPKKNVEMTFDLGWFAKLVPIVHSENIYVAVNSTSGKKTLLIYINKKNLINFKEFKTNGFDLFFEKADDDNVRVCIQLMDNQFEEIFYQITDLLINSVKDIKEEKELLNKLLDRISIYQSFFEKPILAFSKNAQQGLFAELEFMEKILFDKIGIKKSLELWKAPESGLHDFTGNGNSIEIKSTNQIPSQNIKITSENQLNNQRVNSLYLCVAEVNRDGKTGHTLDQKIYKIRKIIIDKEPDLITDFDYLLNKYGFFMNDKILPKYFTRFKINLFFYYEVKEEFPRIVPSKLIEGVNKVSYSINLNLCEKWRTDEANATKKL